MLRTIYQIIGSYLTTKSFFFLNNWWPHATTFKSITETCDKEMGIRQGKILFVPIFDLLSTFMGPFLDIFILINRRSVIQSTSLTSRLNSSTGNILSNMQDEPLFIMYPLYVHVSWSPAESWHWSERPGLAAVASRPTVHLKTHQLLLPRTPQAESPAVNKCGSAVGMSQRHIGTC